MNGRISGPLLGAENVFAKFRHRFVTRTKPVATTVICTLSPKLSSITEPKMMFASGSAASEIISAASLISNKTQAERYPLMLSKMPFAPSIEVSSNGLLIAILAASAARFSPSPTLIPIKASP